MKAIYLGSIIQWQFSGWQLFRPNYQLILWGNSLGASCSGTNFLGSNYQADSFSGAIILENNFPGEKLSWSANCLGGNYRRLNCLVPNSRFASIINGVLSDFWYWLNSKILVSSEGIKILQSLFSHTLFISVFCSKRIKTIQTIKNYHYFLILFLLITLIVFYRKIKKILLRLESLKEQLGFYYFNYVLKLFFWEKFLFFI